MSHTGSSRFASLAIGAILLIALALRLPGLERLPLTNDEAWTLLIRESPAVTLMFQPVDATGGLYYLFAKAVGAISAEPLAIRYLSLAFNLMMIAVGFRLGERAGGTGTGIVTAGILAVMPLSIFTGQNGRAYALVALAVAVSALGLMRWLVGGNRRDAALYAAGAVAAFYSHPTAAFWIAPSLYLFARDALVGCDEGRRRTALVAGAAMALLAVPEAWRLFRPEAHTGFDWIVQPAPVDALWSTIRNLMPVMPTDDPGSLTISASAIAAVLAIAFTGKRERLSGYPLAVALILLSFPLWLWLFGLAVTPIFLHRALLPAAIGLAVLLGHGAIAGRSRRQAMIRGATIVALYALGQGRDRYVDPWDQMRDNLAAMVKPGDAIMVCPFWATPALAAELHRRPLSVSAPLLQWRPARIIMVGNAATMDRDWARRWNRGIYRLDRRYAFADGQIDPVRPVAIPMRRTLVVVDECPAGEWAAIRDWLGSKAEMPGGNGYRIVAIPGRPTVRELSR